MGEENIIETFPVRQCSTLKEAIRAADAKEVGVGNPAEETYRYPNQTCRHPKHCSQDVNT
jgi:hypothetical protein